MKQYGRRVWTAHRFEYDEYSGLQASGGRFNAWRHKPDGGVWYAADGKTYEVSEMQACSVCVGGKVLSEDGLPTKCIICDGRSYIYVATAVNKG